MATSVLSLDVSYERSYSGGRARQICSPIGTSGSLACADGVLGAPVAHYDKIATAEWRWMVSPRHRIAIAPRAQYDIDTHTASFLLPIYVAPNDKQAMDGGVALGWDSDQRFQASVFVGKAFTFFP